MLEWVLGIAILASTSEDGCLLRSHDPVRIISSSAIAFVPSNLDNGLCIEARTDRGWEVRLLDYQGRISKRHELAPGERSLAYDAGRKQLLKAPANHAGVPVKYFEARDELWAITDDSVRPLLPKGQSHALPRKENTAVGYDPGTSALYQLGVGASAQLYSSCREPTRATTVRLQTPEGKPVRRHMALRTIGVLSDGHLVVELTLDNFSTRELSDCWKVNIGKESETCFARLNPVNGVVRPFGVFKRSAFGDFPPTTYQSFVLRGNRIFFIGDGKLFSGTVPYEIASHNPLMRRSLRALRT